MYTFAFLLSLVAIIIFAADFVRSQYKSLVSLGLAVLVAALILQFVSTGVPNITIK